MSINVKTEYSLLSSMIKIPSLIEFALKHNLDTLCICDTNMYGVGEFYEACLKNNIKPIIGMEVNIYDSLLLFAQNKQGYLNLLKINTLKEENMLTIDSIKPYLDNLYLVTDDTKYDELEVSYLTSNDVNTKPVYYLESDDKLYYPYLKCIKDSITIKEYKKDDNDYSFKTGDVPFEVEVYNLYNESLLPDYSENDDKLLTDTLFNNFKNKFGSTAPKVYVDRLKHEVNIIKNMGFSNYFLIVEDYIKYAKENNILIGPGRGSAAGSLVSYLLGITNVDPIKYDLMFERFLNPARISMPDIDIDFDNARRDEVINYMINKYGQKRCMGIVTFGTLASKQVIRDVSKVLDIDDSLVNKCTKLMNHMLSLKDNLRNQELTMLLEQNNALKNVFKVALKLEGLKRHTSIHAAGIVVSSKDIDNVIPIIKAKEDLYLTGYTLNYLEQYGLLKMDFLGLQNLNLINKILELINDDIDINNLPLDDKKTLNIFYGAKTLGVFQFESSGMINFLEKYKASSFDDIIAALALYRPGPMKNIDSYIRRKEGKEKTDYIHPSLKSILEPTYGIIVYQEQIMAIVIKMANFTLGEADTFRKAISKKNEQTLKELRNNFLEKSINNNYTKEVAETVYDLIEKFASYGFNKAHAVSYGKIAYVLAYLKANYKKEFYTASMNNISNDKHKLKDYINECLGEGINIIKPDLNNITIEFENSHNGIVIPITLIKGINKQVAITIINNKPYNDIYDFVSKNHNIINKEILTNLISANLFKGNTKALINSVDLLINYSNLVGDLDINNIPKPVIEDIEDYSGLELKELEYSVYSLYLSHHPVLKYNHLNRVNTKNISNYFNKVIDTILLVETKREVITKNNTTMCFITGSDEKGNVDLVLFPKVYEQYKNINIGDIINVKGKVEKRNSKYQIIVQYINKKSD
jgi:DNA polymerase-3 subunit alpha